MHRTASTLIIDAAKLLWRMIRVHIVVGSFPFLHSPTFPKYSMTTPPSPRAILSLYSSTLRAANSFSSYNFRNYFLRRTKESFRSMQVCADG